MLLHHAYNICICIFLFFLYQNRFSYKDTPRARILARDHIGVTDVPSMMHLMRSNDFRNDPESRCESCAPPYSAANAISSR